VSCETIHPTDSLSLDESLQPDVPLTPRWLHWWAIATVLLTLPLLFLGAEVTTHDDGMRDRDGFSHFREPTILIRQWFEGALRQLDRGYTVEHGHRLQGIVVGLATIILALGFWLGARPHWMRWLGPAALLAVVAQGLLGAFRVLLETLLGARLGRHLALVHGWTAQLVLALLLCTVVVTARHWQQKHATSSACSSRGLRWLALTAVTLVYAQLVLGGLVRHNVSLWGPGLHVLAAFAVVAAAVLLLRDWFAKPALSWREVAMGCLLALVLLAQLALGLESWLCRFHAVDAWGQPLEPFTGELDIVRTIHYVTGSLVFAVTVVMALWVHRPGLQDAGAARSTTLRHRQTEEVA
jgi:cytochrome c oxidase assembly protein subunit 15